MAKGPDLDWDEGSSSATSCSSSRCRRSPCQKNQFYQTWQQRRPSQLRQTCCRQRWVGKRHGKRKMRRSVNRLQQHPRQRPCVMHFSTAAVGIPFYVRGHAFAWPKGTATWEMLVAIATTAHIRASRPWTSASGFNCTTWTLLGLFKLFFWGLCLLVVLCAIGQNARNLQ